MGEPEQRKFDYSPAVSAASEGMFGIGSNLAWDGYQRELYNRLNAALDQQARALRARGLLTEIEARALVFQRNALVAETRKQLSPFGRLYSEILKPSKSLPIFDDLVARKGSIEAVVESVGRTRAVVNRASVVLKNAGRAGVAIQVVVSAVVIAQARPDEERARVAAGQVGAVGGSAVGGWGGAWAGCATAALLASPSLAIPVVGEASEGTACLVGGILGGFGFGMLGGAAGQHAGEAVYDLVTRLRWTRP